MNIFIIYVNILVERLHGGIKYVSGYILHMASVVYIWFYFAYVCKLNTSTTLKKSRALFCFYSIQNNRRRAFILLQPTRFVGLNLIEFACQHRCHNFMEILLPDSFIRLLPIFDGIVVVLESESECSFGRICSNFLQHLEKFQLFGKERAQTMIIVLYNEMNTRIGGACGGRDKLRPRANVLAESPRSKGRGKRHAFHHVTEPLILPE